MYLPSPEPIIDALSRLVHKDGIVSLIAKNGEALAMQAALERRYADARALFDASDDVGRVGVVNRGDSLRSLSAAFEQHGLDLVAGAESVSSPPT
jgi:hypothetical protein